MVSGLELFDALLLLLLKSNALLVGMSPSFLIKTSSVASRIFDWPLLSSLISVDKKLFGSLSLDMLVVPWDT